MLSFAHRSLLTLAVATAVATPAVAGNYGDKQAAAPATQSQNAGTIVDVAASNPQFSTLVAAVKAAGLVETLSGPGPFTVFAPTNEAFAKLPAGTLEDLLKPENKAKLASILTYHVVSGKVLAADAVKLDKATTVNGADADINVAGSTVTIDGSKITATDVAASNGVIHVIDTVMLPE
jgi:uncharacterized surface protein with fasciclin (FAS1) repeats